ncbi:MULTISPECIES: SSI family serine proteinase inhibitor [Streptomyces]|uniref:SSI family serine proteinase inhibitor n=1 Tax=Streptomyces TaxID=1883 RepID=UPI001D13311D|nr:MULTISPECIES: SSI family serine proteinase inhibitor [Streptomyces]MCC3652739.1 subtilase-type protease inhibitor [Streptomyces sp. S07_1.15]WSQ72635.1 subtilase-type protease inhibitor [Streptomyces xinghaiensis]
MPLRRLAAGALCALALLTAAPAASAGAPPSPPSSPAEPVDGYRVPPAGEDRLTILVRDGGGDRILEGAYSLDCHPPGGTHPRARAACKRLDELTRYGRNPFAPVPPRSDCTMIYGGRATARITGSWAGRPVNARYNRVNGCEIARWNRLRPVLPDVGH